MARRIKDYPDYLITRHGEVISTRCGKRKKIKKLLKKSGRYKVNLRNENGPKALFVSRLVAIAYVPNPHNYPMVLHKDSVRTNNYYKNLEWGTHKMNMAQKHKETLEYGFLRAFYEKHKHLI